MTHRYRIEPSFDLLIDKFEGAMGWHDVFGGILRSTKDPQFQPFMNVVVDLTDADFDFGHEGQRRLSSSISMVSAMKFGQIAVVAPESLQFGLARMFGMLSEDVAIFAEYHVFRVFSETRTWLGLPEDVELRLQRDYPADTDRVFNTALTNYAKLASQSDSPGNIFFGLMSEHHRLTADDRIGSCGLKSPRSLDHYGRG